MRKLLALLLAMLTLLTAAPALGQAPTATPAADAADAEPLTVAEIALMGRPVSETPTHVTVGNNTKVSGAFFTEMWGNNTSDIDVRTLLHGYNTVAWSSQLQFVVDPTVVADLSARRVSGNAVYTITLQRDLLYCDGKTPITAKDYVFSLLLCASPQLAELGAASSRYEQIVGYDAYHSGKSAAFSGVRLVDDYTFSIAVKADYQPFFYDLAYIWCIPYPREVIAPYCDVQDTRKGASLCNVNPEDPTVPFTADILRASVLDPDTGYLSHPALTSGPYRLTAYNQEAGRVEFALNPYYKGNFEGVRPVIDTLTLQPAATDTMVAQLQSSEVQLLNKCVDASVVDAGLSLTEQGVVLKNYARLGYGFCAFACEKGPQQFTAVRQALAYCVDKTAFVADYLHNYGLPVYGYYGLGQWMLLASLGSLRPTDATAAELARWDALTLDSLNHYDVNLQTAEQLLVDDGWTLNEQGEPFVKGVDTVRYKLVNKTPMRLSFTFAQAEGNEGAALIVKQLQTALPQIGGELVPEIVPFSDMLSDYYRESGERHFDMNFMASNFSSVFDPYYTFNTDEQTDGVFNTSGLHDKKLMQLAWNMHKTATMDLLTYEENWLKFQTRFNELLPTLPLYSNVYFDFHTDWLQNYEPSAYSGWATAILYAYMAEPVAESATVAPEATVAPDAAEDGEIVILD